MIKNKNIYVLQITSPDYPQKETLEDLTAAYLSNGNNTTALRKLDSQLKKLLHELIQRKDKSPAIFNAEILAARVARRLKKEFDAKENFASAARWLENYGSEGWVFQKLNSTNTPAITRSLNEVRGNVNYQVAEADYYEKNYSAALQRMEKILQYVNDNSKFHAFIGQCYHMVENYWQEISAMDNCLNFIDQVPEKKRANVKTYVAYRKAAAFYHLDARGACRVQLRAALECKPTSIPLKFLNQMIRGAVNLSDGIYQIKKLISSPFKSENRGYSETDARLDNIEPVISAQDPLRENILDDEDTDELDLYDRPPSKDHGASTRSDLHR